MNIILSINYEQLALRHTQDVDGVFFACNLSTTTEVYMCSSTECKTNFPQGTISISFHGMMFDG